MKPIRGGLLSGVVAAFLLLAPLAATSWAVYPGANGRIAYIGSILHDPQDDIYSVLPDGTALLRLTSSERNENDVAWSANGRRLAFVRTTGGYYGGTQVFTMRADGSDKTQVTRERRQLMYGPHFSPTGRWIVYAVDGRGIFKIRPDGAHRHRIVKGYVGYSAYSPSGERIVFAGSPRGRGGGIWSVRPNGSSLTRLTNPRRCCGDGVGDRYPDYSPDGSHIAFERCDDNEGAGEAQEECDLYLMRRDGSDERRILDYDRGTVIYGLSYAPAGDRIAFSFYTLDPFDEVGANVYTVTPSGSDLQPVTHNDVEEPAVEPSWQPIPGP